jgi:pseudouridine-5'-phosphate glycosidase
MKESPQDLVIHPEVRRALRCGRPVVALESTIIAHGMPRPANVETALAAEAAARELGVVPATVGFVAGRLHVGLTPDQIEHLGTAPGVWKASRRDFPWVQARGLDAATTVCGTMLAAHRAGIRMFATGGIGGVHRGANESFDVSADLYELARTPLVVVSAGAKAILDLAKTLELLETLGVPVVGYRTGAFPAFYSTDSGLALEMRAESPEEVAVLFRAQRRLGVEQGLLVANPIPQEAEIPKAVMDGYLAQAQEALEPEHIEGKQVTPFLLGKVLEYSGGKSLAANITLLLNNVRLACAIARELAAEARSGRSPG